MYALEAELGKLFGVFKARGCDSLSESAESRDLGR